MTSLVLLMKHFEALIVSHSNISTLHTRRSSPKPEKPISSLHCDGGIFNFQKMTKFSYGGMTKIAFWKEFNCIHCAEWAHHTMLSFIMNLPFSINTHTHTQTLLLLLHDAMKEPENRHENPQLSDELHTKGEDII